MDDSSAIKMGGSFAPDGSLGGSPYESVYVINLCAANLPQSIDADSVRSWGIPNLETYKLYQVSRMEDGRRRYRLRLGFFTSEEAAEKVLSTVRGKFATAFTSGLCDEDLKHASSYLRRPLEEIRAIQDLQRTGRFRAPQFSPEFLQQFAERSGNTSSTGSHPVVTTLPAQPSIARAASVVLSSAPAPADAVIELELTPQKPSTARSKPAVTQPTPEKPAVAALKQRPSLELTASTPPVTTTRRLVAANEPFHVGAGRTIPDPGLSLAPDRPAIPPSQTPSPVSRPLMSDQALAKLRAGSQPRQSAAVIPTLDTTQTIRTLTKTEIEDANAPKWYVVQLTVSDQPANLDTMPRIDIFEAYRLYSVAILQNNVIRHALRLGFFSEEVSAEAVMGYLKTFFSNPSVERVSDAEQKRFAEPPAASAANSKLTKTQSRVITLEEKRPLASPTSAPHAPAKPVTKTVGKAASPAVKRSPPMTKKNVTTQTRSKKLSTTELDEARMLGLSDSAILRVERNPSLLARLVDKLTK